jgi:hypothetical protein
MPGVVVVVVVAATAVTLAALAVAAYGRDVRGFWRVGRMVRGRGERGEVDTRAVIVVMGGAVQVDDGRTWKV